MSAATDLTAVLREGDLPPELLASLVTDLADSELRELVGGALWPAVLDEVVRRAPELMDSTRAKGISGVLAFEVRGPTATADHVTLKIADDACEAAHADTAPAYARVTLTVGRPEMVRLITGRLAPATAFLRGDLELAGDVDFALEVAGLFRLPVEGSSGAVDPLGIDAVEIAGVIRTVPDDDLRERLRGGLRDTVLEEIFRRFPDYLSPDGTRDVDAVIKFTLTERADGGADRYLVHIDHGKCRAGRDLDLDPRVTIRLGAGDFLKLVTGNLNPTMAFLRRRLVIKGDLGFAAALPRLFRIPRAD
jgi:putative sterol carrier protein